MLKPDGSLPCSRPALTYQGHEASVTRFDLSQDGHLLFSGSEDGTARLWNLATGECLRIIRPQAGPVKLVSILPDKSKLLTSYGDSALAIWDLPSGKLLHIWRLDSGSITALAVSPDSQFVGYGDQSGNIHLFSLMAFDQILYFFRAHPQVKTMNPGSLVAGSNFEFAYQDNLGNLAYGRTYNEKVDAFFGHAGPITVLLIIKNGKFLVSGGADNTLRLWDLEQGKCRWLFGGGHWKNGFAPQALYLTLDQKYIVELREALRLWHLSSRKIKRWFWQVWPEQPASTFIHCTAMAKPLLLLPNGKYVLGTDTNTFQMHLYAFKTGEVLHCYVGHTQKIHQVQVIPNSTRAISCSQDSTLMQWVL